MRAGKIARLVGRAAAVAVLGLGVSAVTGSAVQASDWNWDAVTDGGPASPSDWNWDKGVPPASP